MLILAFLAFSCKNTDDNYTAYFGGEISNPRSPYVVFSKGNHVIDTIALDEHNRFYVKFDSLSPGLYTFKHEPDYQYVYFDRNDSLIIHTNAKDFDQSLIFTGPGERKNNFLIELYLQNEKDREASYDAYNLEYNDFKKNIDSVYTLRKRFYQKNKSLIQWGDDFDFYANARVNFNYYTKKEYYPYLYVRRHGREINSTLPDNYYDHRKSIDFNNPKLTNFSPFARYLAAMLSNMAITKAQRNGNIEENPLRDNIEKLRLTDSIFTNEKIKNEVLNNIAFNYLLEDQNIINNQEFLKKYITFSTDTSADNEIRKISEAIKSLKNGNRMPAISLVDSNNQPFTLEENIKSQTVLFFWTGCARTQKEIVYKKIATLKKQFPEVDFIAINIDEGNEWKKRLGKDDAKLAKQLRATDFYELKDKWAFTKINRTIILNADGSIKNAFTSLSDTDFAKHLE